ncbi:transposase, partial [Clostridium perfringens]
GYIPINSIVKSGTVSQKADRYYVSILVEERDIEISNGNTGIKIFNHNNEGVGIDLGIKEFAVCSDGIKFKNINKISTIKKIEKKLKREQRKLSRKYESLKIRNKNIKEG